MYFLIYLATKFPCANFALVPHSMRKHEQTSHRMDPLCLPCHSAHISCVQNSHIHTQIHTCILVLYLPYFWPSTPLV